LVKLGGIVIDIIIPVYNQKSLVLDCINSVLSANYTFPHELIIIDDASTDEALQIELKRLESKGLIKLYVNACNLGFTKSVNKGMMLNETRDVLLLNSDTLVFNNWLDRIRAVAYSSSMVATVNPMTNYSHISSYPTKNLIEDFRFIDYYDPKDVDVLASNIFTSPVKVHSTVGFCMFIKRTALNDVGVFDDVNFPFGYGEETDFCYRASSRGWVNLVAGNVFVYHVGGSSFGDRKHLLMKNMVSKFAKLHPSSGSDDYNFAMKDPLRLIRVSIDLQFVKRILNGDDFIHLYDDKNSRVSSDLYITADLEKGHIFFKGNSQKYFLNIPVFSVVADVVKLNTVFSIIGVNRVYVHDSLFSSLAKCFVLDSQLEVSLSAQLLDASSDF